MAGEKSCEGPFIEGIRNVKRIEHDTSEVFKKLNEQVRSIGKLTVDIDVSGALTGLKAVQREAKKATAALKEFEEEQKKTLDPELFKMHYLCQWVDKKGTVHSYPFEVDE